MGHTHGSDDVEKYILQSGLQNFDIPENISELKADFEGDFNTEINAEIPELLDTHTKYDAFDVDELVLETMDQMYDAVKFSRNNRLDGLRYFANSTSPESVEDIEHIAEELGIGSSTYEKWRSGYRNGNLLTKKGRGNYELTGTGNMILDTTRELEHRVSTDEDWSAKLYNSLRTNSGNGDKIKLFAVTANGTPVSEAHRHLDIKKAAAYRMKNAWEEIGLFDDEGLTHIGNAAYRTVRQHYNTLRHDAVDGIRMSEDPELLKR